jgi:hypothetical protein
MFRRERSRPLPPITDYLAAIDNSAGIIKLVLATTEDATTIPFDVPFMIGTDQSIVRFLDGLMFGVGSELQVNEYTTLIAERRGLGDDMLMRIVGLGYEQPVYLVTEELVSALQEIARVTRL